MEILLITLYICCIFIVFGVMLECWRQAGDNWTTIQYVAALLAIVLAPIFLLVGIGMHLAE